MKTVLELIRATSAYFEKHGVESPRLNIEHLLAHALGIKRMELYLQFDRPVSEAEMEPLRELVRRRASGEPLQHVLGTVEFLGNSFLCDKRALIPRHETEQLCEILLARYKDPKFVGRALDVGVGSGVIALTLATHWTGASIEGVDISEQALELTRCNSDRLGIGDKAKFYASDLLGNASGSFDLIVANLPYIARQEIATLAPEVRHDPAAALDGGETGLELLNRLIETAAPRLHGLLALEIGADQAAAISAELTRNNYQDIEVTADYQGRDRFVFATHG